MNLFLFQLLIYRERVKVAVDLAEKILAHLAPEHHAKVGDDGFINFTLPEVAAQPPVPPQTAEQTHSKDKQPEPETKPHKFTVCNELARLGFNFEIV